MGNGRFCLMVAVLISLVVAFAMTVIGVVTDNWYEVETSGVVTETYKKANNYRFGFWRRCYDSRPASFADQGVFSGNKCIWTFRDLLPHSNESVPFKQMLVIHLSRSTIGLCITAAALCLAALITLICGNMPGKCSRPRRSKIHIAAIFIVMFASAAGFAGGICFVVARDVEYKDLNYYIGLDTSYSWSFILHWIGTGMSVISGFLLMCQLKYHFEDYRDDAKYYDM